MRMIASLHRINLIILINIIYLVVLSACSTANVDGAAQEVNADSAAQGADESASQGEWQEEFNLADRKLEDSGETTYFILQPGFEIVLESNRARLIITVLDETKDINGIRTRVVEEREEINGELYEISRNFFAIDPETGDVFYFGEEVDFYENGEIVRHSGEWLAYENGNKPGLIMPGTPGEGMKYFQEIASGVAMDRAEVISVSETYETPAGEFEDCLVTEESTPLEPLVKEYKRYAPGIGMIQDETLKLVSYGYRE